MTKKQANMIAELVRYFWIMVSMVSFGLYAMDLIEETTCGIVFIMSGIAVFNSIIIKICNDKDYGKDED